jgi:hypothetical protein
MNIITDIRIKLFPEKIKAKITPKLYKKFAKEVNKKLSFFCAITSVKEKYIFKKIVPVIITIGKIFICEY